MERVGLIATSNGCRPSRGPGWGAHRGDRLAAESRCPGLALLRQVVQRDRWALDVGQHAIDRSFVLEFAAGRLSGLFKAVPSYIIKPPMIQTTKATILAATVTQVGRTMGAMKPKQSRLASIVAKQYKIFTKNPNGDRRATRFYFQGKANRLPVAAEQLPAWSSRVCLGQQGVFFLTKHNVPYFQVANAMEHPVPAGER